MTQAGLVVISTASIEYVRVGVRYSSTPELESDPTLLPVSMAFLEPGETPVTLDFKVAEWRIEDEKLYILCLVGNSIDAVINLSPGFYNVWIKITSNPEVIVKMAGSITVK